MIFLSRRNNYNYRHDKPAIKDVWITQRWGTRVFSFFFAITEVNCYYAFKFFVWKKGPDEDGMTFQKFRKKMAKALIQNDLFEKEGINMDLRDKNDILHVKLTAPPHAKCFDAKSKWDLTAKSKYQQYICKGHRCRKQVRTYCKCSPGYWLCDSCLCKHILNVQKN